MKYTKEYREARVKELQERISRNKFINDCSWRERGEQVIKDMGEIEALNQLELDSQKMIRKIEEDYLPKVQG